MPVRELYRVTVGNYETGLKVVCETDSIAHAIKEGWQCVRDGIDPSDVDILCRNPSTFLWMSFWTEGGA